MHYSKGYDPVKAHEYYMRTRRLKGRKKGASILNTARTVDRKTRNKARIASGKKAVTNFLNKVTGKKQTPPPHASTHYAKPKPNSAHNLAEDIKRRTKGNARLEYGKRAVVKYTKKGAQAAYEYGKKGAQAAYQYGKKYGPKAAKAASRYAKKEAAYIRSEARRRSKTQADRWK